MSSAVTVPQSHLDLLEQPNFVHLSTVRPVGSPQGSVMWFEWNGTHVLFTHTSGRQKMRNLQREPRVSVLITDPADPYRTLEIRGVVESIEPDPGAAFYQRLQQRYGRERPVYDADQRVVVSVRPTQVVTVDGGLTAAEQVVRRQLIADLAARDSAVVGDEQKEA